MGIRLRKKKPLIDEAHSINSAEPTLLISRVAYYARVTATSLLTTTLWVFSARYRRRFRALNDCMRQHPTTAFVFLSPFPCLVPADNALRDFGGWLFRRFLIDLPNRYWLDSHRVLRPDPQMFVDTSHLNEIAHRVLAHSLVALILSNIDSLL